MKSIYGKINKIRMDLINKDINKLKEYYKKKKYSERTKRKYNGILMKILYMCPELRINPKKLEKYSRDIDKILEKEEQKEKKVEEWSNIKQKLKDIEKISIDLKKVSIIYIHIGPYSINDLTKTYISKSNRINTRNNMILEKKIWYINKEAYGKGKESRRIKISTPLLEELKILTYKENNVQLLKGTPNAIQKQLKKKIGIPYIEIRDSYIKDYASRNNLEMIKQKCKELGYTQKKCETYARKQSKSKIKDIELNIKCKNMIIKRTNNKSEYENCEINLL